MKNSPFRKWSKQFPPYTPDVVIHLPIIPRGTRVRIVDMGTLDMYYENRQEWMWREGIVTEGLERVRGFYSGYIYFPDMDANANYFYFARVGLIVL